MAWAATNERVANESGCRLAAGGCNRWTEDRIIFETLGNLGDFMGGIAVIASLLYLARQVGQNTAAMKTASRQEIVAAYRDHNRLSGGGALAARSGNPRISAGFLRGRVVSPAATLRRSRSR